MVNRSLATQKDGKCKQRADIEVYGIPEGIDGLSHLEAHGR